MPTTLSNQHSDFKALMNLKPRSKGKENKPNGVIPENVLDYGQGWHFN